MRHGLVVGAMKEQDRGADVFDVREGGTLFPQRAGIRKLANQLLLVVDFKTVRSRPKLVQIADAVERNAGRPEIGLLSQSHQSGIASCAPSGDYYFLGIGPA